MPTLAIDINDAGLVVASRESVLAVEPGYALIDKGTIRTGWQAYAQGRLKPRYVTSAFWSSLSMEPGSAGIDGAPSAADLAFAQLDALWRKHKEHAGDVVLVVPARYGAPELGLLLGLTQECGMPVRAMIDAAVAASSKPYPGRQLLYVDAGLHRVSATPMKQSEQVAARPEHALETTGLAGLMEQFARRVAEIFVLTTRFDPFRQAESEQLLYDRLPEWLRALNDQDEAELTLPFDGTDHVAKVASEQLLGAASGFYRAVVQLIAQAREPGQALTVQLSDRLASLPGLAVQLARLDDAEIVSLPPGHAARAALLDLGEIDFAQGQVKLLKHMKWREPADAQTAPPVAPAAPRKRAVPSQLVPTHIVHRGIAYPVAAEGLFIGRTGLEGRRVIVVDDQRGGVSSSHCEIVLRDGEVRLHDLSRHGTFVNEKRVAGDTVLHPADVIRVGSPGAELIAIRVELADAHA